MTSQHPSLIGRKRHIDSPSRLLLFCGEESSAMGLSEVFVGDLSYFCGEADLLKHFDAFGPIQNAVIKRDSSGNSLLYGFVHFSSVAAAKRAVQLMNGQKFMGRTIM